MHKLSGHIDTLSDVHISRDGQFAVTGNFRQAMATRYIRVNTLVRYLETENNFVGNISGAYASSLFTNITNITARIPKEWEGTVFTGVCLFTFQGRGTPIWLMGVPQSFPMGGYRILGQDGDTSISGPDGGGTPGHSPVQVRVGYPHAALYGGTPLLGLDGGTPLSRTGWGYSPFPFRSGPMSRQGVPTT